MSSESFFWKCLDTRLGPVRESIWKLALGEKFDLARRYLVPSPRLATEVSCEHSSRTACSYRIVEHEDGAFAGICDDGRCPRRVFDRTELIRYEIQHTRLLADVASVFSLDPKIEPLHGPGISFRIGALPPFAICDLPSAICLLFTRQSNPEDFSTFVEKQILANPAPFILLNPTLRHMTPDVAALLQRNNCRSLALDGGILFGARGLRATDHFLSTWKALCASFTNAYHAAPSTNLVEEPSIAPEYALIREGATWRIHFSGDTFSVRHSIGFDQLAHLLHHWQHAFTPIEVRQLVDPRDLGEASPNGESRETEASAETASADSILQIKRRLQKLNQEEAENEGHEVALQEIADERVTLEQELIRITTPDGRVRREGGTMDKARKAVSNNLARLRKRIAEESPACARHLWQRLTLGFSMTYTPDLGEEWIVKIRPKK